MNVVVNRGRVVVVSPPGQSAVLSARQTRLLDSALARAAANAPGRADAPAQAGAPGPEPLH
jgi:hypothetical protein